MAKSTRSRSPRRGRGLTGSVRISAPRQPRPLAADLSRRARARLAMVDWHRAHGSNVSLTARRFGVSRPTVYRWLARFDRFRLESLEDRSSRPRRSRRPTWTVEQLRAVRAIREAYPRWGKDKLRALLRRDGVALSGSMIGRILARLRHSGELREPRVRRRMTVRQRRWQRPYAVRRPSGWVVERPGDLVELDTLDIRVVPGKIWKQFTARDLVSRWDTVELGRQATAHAAAAMLDRLAERMPFPVRAISIDNGSEFMADFEAACRDRAIALFVLPPRSPRLHGAVERANRTHAEEFYEVTDAEPELEAFQAGLRAWELVYNTVRPHQAPGYLTPSEFLASLEARV